MNPMRLFKYLAMAMTLLTALEEAKGILAFLAADDYEGASAALLASPSLQDDLAKLPAEVQTAAPLLLPVLLKGLDRVIPEEKILAAMG